jgi:hypothetical protein
LRGVLYTSLCGWFSLGTLFSSTNTTEHDTIEILLKVALNTITVILTLVQQCYISVFLN